MSRFFKSVLGVTKEASTALVNSTEQLHINLIKQNHDFINNKFFDNDIISALEALANSTQDFCYISKSYFDVYYQKYLHGDSNIIYENQGKQQNLFFNIFSKNIVWHINIIRFDYQKEYDTVILYEGAYRQALNSLGCSYISNLEPQRLENKNNKSSVDINEAINLIDKLASTYTDNGFLEIRRVVNFTLENLGRRLPIDQIKEEYGYQLFSSSQGLFSKKNDSKTAHIKFFITKYLIDEIGRLYNLYGLINHSDYSNYLSPKVLQAAEDLKQRVYSL